MSARLSLLAALALTLSILVMAGLLLIKPAIDWRSEMIALASAAQEEKSRLTQVRARLNAEETALATGQADGLFWSASQAGEAYARVQSALAKSASENGITFRAATPLPTTRDGALESAVVRVEFESDLEQLTGFLRDIEFATPALPVERATLRRLIRPNETSRQPVLFSQIDIAAPVLIGDGS